MLKGFVGVSDNVKTSTMQVQLCVGVFALKRAKGQPPPSYDVFFLTWKIHVFDFPAQLAREIRLLLKSTNCEHFLNTSLGHNVL